MKCERCGTENRAEASYCAGCGRFLGVCPACGAHNPVQNRFCDACGKPLRAQGAAGAFDLRSVLFAARRAATIAVARSGIAGFAKALRAEVLEPAGRAVARPRNPRLLVWTGVTLAVLGQLWFWLLNDSRDPSPAAVLALIFGVVLFALGSQTILFDVPSERRPLEAVPIPGPVKGRRVAFAVVLGVLLFAGLLQALAVEATEGWYLYPWIAAILLLGMHFATGRIPIPNLRRLEIVLELLFVGLVITVFLALNVRDQGDWYYSAIGDEYAFYIDAREQAINGITRPFDQAGVYGKHPVLGTVFQALIMRLIGIDNFGWKFSSALAIAATIPGVYVLARTLGDRKLAIIASTLFAASHYLFAYAHTGYHNIHAVVLAVWSMAVFALGVKHKSAAALYVAGVLAGLGFYSFFSARAGFPILVVFALTLARSRKGLAGLLPLTLGFVLAAAPIFAASGWETVSRMIEEVPGGYSPDVTGPVAARILENLSRNLLAFNFNPDAHHYVSGSLLDPVTAVLAALGAGLAVRHAGTPSLRLLLIWVTVGLISTGLLSPYPGVAISRLNFVLPPMVILAAFAARQSAAVFAQNRIRLRKRWVGPAAVTALLTLVLMLNIDRFWRATPSTFQLSQAAISVGAFRSDLCKGPPSGVLFVGRSVQSPLQLVLESYSPGRPISPMLDDYSRLVETVGAAGSLKCVVFTFPDQPEAAQTLEALQRAYPKGALVAFSDRANKGRVQVFTFGTS